MGRERYRAASAEPAHDFPLGPHAACRPGVRERREPLADRRVVEPALDADRALAGGRQAFGGGEAGGDARLETEAPEPRARQHDRVELSGVELAEPGLDVAAQRLDHRVLARGTHLRASPQARGADARFGRQRGERRGVDTPAHDQRVARVAPLADRLEPEPLGKLGRHVLHRVHRHVRAAVVESGLELLDEPALAADARQRRRLEAVAAGRDRHELHLDPGPALQQRALHPLGLPDREVARPRRDSNALG